MLLLAFLFTPWKSKPEPIPEPVVEEEIIDDGGPLYYEAEEKPPTPPPEEPEFVDDLGGPLYYEAGVTEPEEIPAPVEQIIEPLPPQVDEPYSDDIGGPLYYESGDQPQQAQPQTEDTGDKFIYQYPDPADKDTGKQKYISEYEQQFSLDHQQPPVDQNNSFKSEPFQDEVEPGYYDEKGAVGGNNNANRYQNDQQ